MEKEFSNLTNIKFDLLYLIKLVAPKYDDVLDEVNQLKLSHPKLTKIELSKKFAKRIRNNYTSVGIASAFPSIIPGLGTAVQVVVEGTTVTGDLMLMLRGMARMCYGVGIINDKDMTQGFNQDLISILGIWSGVIVTAKIATEKLGTKVAVAQFNRHVTGKMLQKINKRVSTTILTKYGTKRGGVALGKLIPFGVGAVIGGGFNYVTMKSYSIAAIKHYESADDVEYVILE
ncbi:hypothetical protein [Kaistella antarctica]|uniref:EcsC family protein n=1 Tax=Kaistella antarctica TaxID=266748 RepID=A0A448NUY1_9FLAO|nr:hypothetical protein [Kaistella antarctica]KEY20331.1 hypothetical protein HY04_03780 [Kaistella antarctica]SEV90890.1 hypothetical protein SAMN05421765_1014 [Kaistella antarctica]VEI01542.1 Uncharacterised protein [Kaistella antarctica]